ncbi:MAG: hypothetical protein EXS51_02055 [Candidatus Taylorbacteria bacterium]|nr:hypothetical protein [Candidatus Taylorbacteria bacterium]
MPLPEEKQQSTATPPPKERRNTLDELENRLYSRTPPPLRHDEEFIGEERHIRIAPGWTSDAERKESATYSMLATVMPWLKRLFVASIIFFFFAAGIAFYGFWRGGNTISPQNISVDIAGPVGIGAGEELTLDITVGNDNALDLDAVDLLVEFPDGTRKPGKLSESLLRYRDSLGPLPAGQKASRKISLVPFGEEGEEKTIAVTAEYRPKDSNAIFSRKVEYTFLLSSAPVTLDLSIPKEVSSDQTFEMTVDLASNSASVQKGLLLKVQYPFGFQFIESTPSPSFGKDGWLIGDLAPSGKRNIRIKGKLIATEQAERAFRFSVGTQSIKDERQLGTTFLSEVPSIVIQRPFMTLDLLLSGEQGKTFVGRSGQTVRADISWGNNLSTKIADLEITAKLTGVIYNRTSVSTYDGYYDSNTNSIVWDQRRVGRFSAVEPGETGTQNFSFIILPVATTPALFKNPQMTIEVTARGKRLDEQGLYQDVVATVTKEIKIATTLSLSSKLFHEGGVFDNIGYLPPKAEGLTTYTVVWALSNTSNGVADARVSAVLPSYISWQDKVSPATEQVRYNPLGGEVVWSAGEIPAGTGVGTPPREVSFQISLLPSLSQVGTSPVVIGEVISKAMDRFTGIEIVGTTRPAMTTGSISDVGAAAQSGIVVK